MRAIAIAFTFVASVLIGYVAHADQYHPRGEAGTISGISGAMTFRPDLSGRLGGTMPIPASTLPQDRRIRCGLCTADCYDKWEVSCGRAPGCRNELSACIGACRINECRN